MSNVYTRTIKNKHGDAMEVDVYDVLAAYPGVNAAVDHALKKLLVTGGRDGGKSTEQDLRDVTASVQRALEVEGYESWSEDYEAKIAELSLENSNLKSRLKDTEEALEATQGCVDKAQRFQRKYEAERDALAQENARLSEDIAVVRTNWGISQELAKAKDTEIFELKKDSDPSDLLQRKDVEIGVLSKKIVELNDDNQRLRADKERMINRETWLCANYDDLSRDYDYYRDLTQEYKEKISELQEYTTVLNGELDSKSDELLELHKVSAQQSEQLEKANEDYSDLEDYEKEAQDEITRLRDENDELQRNIGVLEGILSPQQNRHD